MRKYLFIILLLIILVVGFIFYRATLKYPSAEAKKIANSIETYPSGTNWRYEEEISSCLLAFDGCWPAYVYLKFSSRDDYKTIHEYYSEKLEKDGWEDDLIQDNHIGSFHKKNGNCPIYLSNQLDRFGEPIEGKYNFYIGCD